MLNQPKRGYYASRPEKCEERQLLYLAQHGDTEESRCAKSLLIIGNERFLRKMIQPWLPGLPWIQPDALMQDARLAFLAAINKYDLSKDVSIRVYAKFYLLELRRTNYRKSKYRHNPLPEDYGGRTNMIPRLDFQPFDLREILVNAGHEALTTREKDVIFLHFFMGMKQKDIASRNKCSPARISSLVKEALGKLKRELVRKGISLDLLEQN
jgi:RNA polymerase sigma factor (sigma-70 family)